ncbi:UTRA domain-containing protein [Sneathiella limimaris]|uniref:UTRA domain-containing protein n=1 Tax=Sneathiella limimaris TaxID=1964213 RepID=UPI00146A3B19
MRKKTKSSFQDIKADILEKIKTGLWSPGDTIPGEEKLAESYGCSRVTVNRALRELAETGFVERRRKSGTRVSEKTVRDARLQIPIVREEIEAKGAKYQFVLLDKTEIQATDKVRRLLGVSENAPVLHVRCLHLADGRPYQYENRWINLEKVPAARDQTFEAISPNEWLIRKEPFSNAEHTFSAALADEETAKLLEIEVGDALFVVERRTWQDDASITAVELKFPGASYKMTSRG